MVERDTAQSEEARSRAVVERDTAQSTGGAVGEAEAAPELAVAADMALRCAVAAPAAVGIGAAVWGWAGVWSVGLALVLVAANFVAGAAVIAWGARRSPAVLMGSVMVGYLARLGALAVVVAPVRSAGWFETAPFAASLLLSHLGLLAWEMRHISGSLAFPGLKPGSGLRLPFASAGERAP